MERMTEPQEHQVIVVGPDGQPMGMATVDATGSDQDEDGPPDVTDMVEQPAKVMRIGTMIKQLLEEVRTAPLDEASRARLREIHERSITELEQGLAPDLRDELRRLSLPFRDDEIPTDAELRVAQAQLVGWLEGLFHGIQTALFAQQMAARVQLEEMRRRALPPGVQVPGLTGRPMMPGQQGLPGQQGEGGDGGTGQYL
jgi:Bacterial proteasome activator